MIVVAALIILGSGGAFWFIRHASQTQVDRSVTPAVVGVDSSDSKIGNRGAAAKHIEEREEELLKSLPPDKRAEAKWALRKWGNADLSKGGGTGGSR